MPEPSYQLLDTGDGAKLERFAKVVLARPAPQALWPRALPVDAWNLAHAQFHRDSTGSGRWDRHEPFSEPWNVRAADLTLVLKTTSFGHVGMFAEQIRFWAALRGICEPGMEVLNLFAYTGGSTLACAAAGASVTHCDASKGILEWARENAQANDLADAPVRYLLDDALKFARREGRRGRRYHGIILDPPSFGRGNKGEVFKLERDLPQLLEACAAILAPDAAFVLLSGHTPGVGALAMRHLLTSALGERGGSTAHGEMTIEGPAASFSLPSGVWAAWTGPGVPGFQGQ